MNIVVALFPLVALIAMGYVLKYTQFVQDEFWANSEKLNYYVLFPVLLFLNVSAVQLDMNTVSRMLTVLVAGTCLISIVLWGIKQFMHIPVQRFGVYIQSHIRFNTYIGLSLMGALFGSTGMQMFAMLIAVAVPLVNIISVLAFSNLSVKQLGQTCQSIAKNPLILGCVVGVLFKLSGLSLFKGLPELLKILAAMSLPLGLLSVGAALQFQQMRADLRRLSFNTIGRLMLMPCIAYLLSTWMGLTDFERMILVVFFALPTASSSYILTRYYQGDSQLMAAIISVQTIGFGLMFPLLMLTMH
ncbi:MULTISPECIES: AEC family transporter [unclassified Acinetobacter]|uniref:AEC family transporter n=1 Tax=unclassified Acinetobacter TaxID=196816 RepID=UPI0015D3C266|nr:MULTISPECIES: AEC family transporter [unclassified Acinetobacter]UUS64588.1 AEC family transporter [Acinetobacter sp. YH12068_T]